jgi:hypothetical protein
MKIIILAFIFFIFTTQQFNQFIYLNNLNCEEPYHQGASNKLDVCYSLQSDYSFMLKANQTHLTQINCRGNGCQKECRVDSYRVEFNRCVQSPPNSMRFTLGEQRPSTRHVYAKAFETLEKCEKNDDVGAITSLVKDLCVNSPSKIFPKYFSKSVSSGKITLVNQRVSIHSYSEASCKGSETTISFDTHKCTFQFGMNFKASDKPF